ncbi:MAG: hypothetical protein Q8P41_22435 [Pseudomonadota bacterium]|nr:hypothetical protein [Pseudomonadota bacterium]
MIFAVVLAACAPTTIRLGDDTATDPGPAVAAAGLTVAVHPEVSTVLVATWTQLVAADTSLSWELDGETFSSPVRARAPGAAEEVVLGLPADAAATVTLHAGATALAAEARTGPLPEGLVAPTLTTWHPAAADPAPYFLTSVDVGPQNFFGPCWVVMLDRSGRIVWYREVADRRLTLFPRVARDGTHVLWDATTYYVADSIPGSITRATLSLSQEVETEVEGIGFTWDELDDGSFLFDYAETGYAYHLERQYPDGTRARVWSCAPWMERYDDNYWACAANTVRWDPDTNVVVWSMFQTSTVVGIDLATGTLLWELGEYPGGLAFEPSTIRLELQHYPNWTPDGTLLLTTHVPDEPGVQRIRELELDVPGGTARQLWSYTPAAGHYGDYAGEATRLPNGNTLVSFGTDGVVQEVGPNAEVAWEIDWADHLAGHLTPVEDLYALDRGW